MSNQNSDLGAFLAGLVLGSLTGAAVALLLAPQSGEETINVIREKSIELRDKAVESSEEARVKAEKALEEARAKANAAIAESRAKAEELAKLTKQRTAELQQRGQAVLEEQKEKIKNLSAPKTEAAGPAEPVAE
ncbi:MAG: hypothetical protein OHK0052_16510 [Anaerolineales bacterium]